MPKRKPEQKLAYYCEKIRRIQEKENKKMQRRVRVILSDSSDSEENATETEKVSETLIAAPQPVDAPGENGTTVPDLDPEVLQALGAQTSDEPVYGDKIHENLSQLWSPLLKRGMSKEDKETTLKQYLIPQNCTLLQAPKLNLEISAALTDSARNKDKKLVAHQQQLGHGITAINRAMDLLLNKDGDGKLEAIKHLSNASRILCDLHHTNSQVRVKLITPSLDKSFLNVIQDCQRDETLFGEKLSEKIKSSKAIEKQGLQIKKLVANTPAPSASTSRPAQGRGNWSAPPRYPSNKSARGGNKRAAPPARKQPAQAPPPPQTRQATKLQQARAQPPH
ncbi:hypothetical protein ABMA27_015108 [Loxostege sticticalis]|uniref:Gag-like protein n=1 Tax=Loxostege sticticalis TaxID=481309 RepID=A0ABR3I6M2_LOXSC